MRISKGLKLKLMNLIEENIMLKNKSIDYIFGMITGASLMLAFWACTQTPLGASGSTVQEVKVVNSSWDAVYVRSAD